jgi:hypothetical protein
VFWGGVWLPAEDAHGDLVYTFTKPWADSTTGITLSPLELLEKLAALGRRRRGRAKRPFAIPSMLPLLSSPRE